METDSFDGMDLMAIITDIKIEFPFPQHTVELSHPNHETI